CGGIAEYFDIDPVMMRILFILFFFFGGFAIVAYVIGMVIMPFEAGESAEEHSTSQQSKTEKELNKPVAANKAPAKSSLVFGIILVALGAFFMMDNIPFLSYYHWWFRWHLKDFFVPGIFIVLGIILLAKSSKKKELDEDDAV
ncbi:MAG: PspC domain-containing protein, partial [bacterium]|nr:PspC domain-containing protein [bacterium]